MENDHHQATFIRKDILITFCLFLFAFVLYIRTLAPNVLYGDSGEFQTLAYTLGQTHSTGYPVYLLLARLIGFLPAGNLAWRINLFSAISAAVTISILYLLARHLTKNRVGPVFGSILMAVSYTFWTQAIIAEVYTPGTAFVAIILLLLLFWCDSPSSRTKHLFWAALLTAVGIGVHASVGLLGFAAIPFAVVIVLQYRSKKSIAKKILSAGVGGSLVGVILLIVAFFIVDLNDPKSSFINVMLKPSRSIWGLQFGDLDSSYERIALTLTGLQWRDAMFPDAISLGGEFIEYLDRFSQVEFSWVLLLISLTSLYVIIKKQRTKGLLLLLCFVVLLFFILNYEPPDKYLFYLPTYVILLTAAGAGLGLFLEKLEPILNLDSKVNFVVQVIFAVFLFVWISGPNLESRLSAVKTGIADFVQEEYVFPVEKPGEPMAVAILYLSELPEDAVLILDWRPLYATYFVAHVEGRNPSLTIYEAMPHGNHGTMAESLIEILNLALKDGKNVYSNDLYPGLEQNFFVNRISGTGLYQLYQQ